LYLWYENEDTERISSKEYRLSALRKITRNTVGVSQRRSHRRQPFLNFSLLNKIIKLIVFISNPALPVHGIVGLKNHHFNHPFILGARKT
jgi:hypothetical protein